METQYLQQQIDELKKEIDKLKSPTTFPIEIENALIQRGFQNVGDKELVLYYEAGVGGNAFTEKYRLTKFRNRQEYESYGNGIKQFTVNTTTNIVTSQNHGFIDDQYISFRTTNTLPVGLDSLIDTYKVLNATADTYQVTTDGVNPVDITSLGVGEQYAFVY